MNDMNRMTRRPRRALRPAVWLAASALLLGAAPAGAGWMDRGVGVAGAGHSLKETLKETTDNLGEMVSAFIEGDDDRVSELAGEIKKTPGKLIKRAFPVFEAPQAIAGRLTSARQKIERFAGGVREGIADARAALATDKDGKADGWSDASLLAGEPLQAATDTAFAAPGLAPRSASPTTLAGKTGQGSGDPADPSWDFEQWVMAKQEANPHCYGVVDPETLPAECFGGTSAESPAGKVEDSPPAKADAWASGNWTADTGWAGWDESDLRYSEDDREAARVGVFAADCWGAYGISSQSGLYELMRDRMQRNECPNDETNQASYDDATVPGDSDYLSALSDLEAQEAERLRLEEEERRRQARLEAEERERQAQLAAEKERDRQARRAAQRRADERERERQREYDLAEQRQQAEYRRQALQNTAESLRGLAEQVNRAYGGGGTTGTTAGNDSSCTPRWIESCYEIGAGQKKCEQVWVDGTTCGQR